MNHNRSSLISQERSPLQVDAKVPKSIDLDTGEQEVVHWYLTSFCCLILVFNSLAVTLVALHLWNMPFKSTTKSSSLDCLRSKILLPI